MQCLLTLHVCLRGWAAKCAAVRPIRQWQTEEYAGMMAAERRHASSFHRTACDLTIQGESVATSVKPTSTDYNRTTGNVDIETVFRACRPNPGGTAASSGPRTSGRTAADGQRACLGANSSTSPRQFCPFPKDDSGRAISTRTPVAKMTAPISMLKAPRVEAVARRQLATASTGKNVSRRSAEVTTAEANAVGRDRKSDVHVSSNKFKSDQPLASGGRKQRSESNSATPRTKTATATTTSGVVGVAAAGQQNTSKSVKNSNSDRQMTSGGRKRRSSASHENNSSNNSAKLRTVATTTVKSSTADVAAGKPNKNNASLEAKDEADDVEDELKRSTVELETAASLSTFQPGEHRRRSHSLQVH